MNIFDAFKVAISRPLDALTVVSIAELAQFTTFQHRTKYPVAAAENAIRKEWNFEVDSFHYLNYLDFSKAIVWFKDGSSLTFKTKGK